MLRTTFPDNPFEIDFETGRPILKHRGADALLAGIHVDTELAGELSNAEIDKLMQFLQDHRNNFYRHWVTAYYLYELKNRALSSPFWFGNGKWDLRLYNEAYFDRLRYILASARRHGIIVQIQLFDCPGLKSDGFGGGSDRWSQNPWNSDVNINGVLKTSDGDGLPEFYQRDTNPVLAQLQDAYAREVVLRTREFSNVIYEIINEPVPRNSALLASWANAILRAIAPLIQGRRLVFYNDHSYTNLNDLNTRGRDVNYWRDSIPQDQSSYDSLDGVIFHAAPLNIDPSPTTTYGWKWKAQKLIQVSSDLVLDITRDDPTWNQNATKTLLDKQQIFQAESIEAGAAIGISRASTKPTVLSLPPFVGCWEKTSTAGPYFNVRFDNRRRFVAFDPVNDVISAQGTITAFTQGTFTAKADGQTTQTTFSYSLSEDGRTLTYANPGQVQTFSRVPFDLEPLLFGWEKIGEKYPSPFSHLFLYFRKHKGEGGNVSMKARDPNNLQNVIDFGEVRSINPPQIVIASHALNGDITYNYELFNEPGDANKMHLRLINLTTPPPPGQTEPRWQEFRRLV